ncbi:lysine-specific demethylase NO66 [Strigomonas culicis]|uniref:Bifunctional lysine-specific demethylase and histidyl-hydroxylase n=1 Tax=Strigomonas culicis TaxID=28005 RepID=S9U4A4_9TRYP|nr:lysine-specific demethylase NO66 [Strigomonas culicis]EPY25251.1 lysine-specific demethylase NO66 [Strigomonas culicis]EPY27886.1 lysine-specific demethylase NO66 [Strigomonas culicis]|eukprot:EPY23589.1 lysine-specific demethylase NO66 [Strigomonas culicis]
MKGSKKRQVTKAEEAGGDTKKLKHSHHTENVETHHVFFEYFLKVSRSEFFKTYFEKKHLLCSHGDPHHFSSGNEKLHIPPIQWSTELMLKHAKNRPLHFGTDISVVRFDKEKGCRVTYKSEGVTTPAELKQCMDSGWSVRFLRPHEYMESDSAFISLMEREFGCYCGLNSYWTPAGTQGFAPHYDDVDVFLFQMEGEKEWRLYDPLDEVGVLTRHSSEDFQLDEYPEPKYFFTLKAGDVLYMPRGMVHQGRTTARTHSLHVTFSANQMNTWADVMQQVAAYSVGVLAANRLEWRKTVPLDLPRVLGIANSDTFRETAGVTPLTELQKSKRETFLLQLRERVAEMTLLMTEETNLDTSVDVYVKESIRKLQPPSAQYAHTVPASVELDAAARVRLVSATCCRLMMQYEGEAQVVHCGTNSHVCLQTEIGELRFEAVFAPAVATLLSRYPKFTQVSSLPFPDFDDPAEVAENQLLLVETLRDSNILQKE